ncbi:MAG: hypothetical protein AAF567_04215 [Actinomycetota bacterium]
MFKRLFWFSSGAATGAAGTMWVRRRIQEQLRRFTPGGVREQAIAKARRAAGDAQILVQEGRTLVQNHRARQEQAGR